MATKKSNDQFFAKSAAGGLIRRLTLVCVALLIAWLLSIAVLLVLRREIHWPEHAIAFALMATAFSVAQWIEGIPIDPQLMLARLLATTAVRLGLPLVGIVVMDRVVQPGFLSNTLIFWAVGFFAGLATSCLISLKRLSQESPAN
jgi:hypothetical protein